MSRAIGRYALLQLPQLALVVAVVVWLDGRLEWPTWVPAAIVGLWVAKEVALYPLLRRSLSDLPAHGGAEELRGMSARVKEALEPEGWVEVRGELWRARSLTPAHDLPAGCAVRVREVSELTLLVEPERGGAQDAAADGRNALR